LKGKKRISTLSVSFVGAREVSNLGLSRVGIMKLPFLNVFIDIEMYLELRRKYLRRMRKKRNLIGIREEGN